MKDEKQINNWEKTIQRLKLDKKYDDLLKSCYYDDPIDNAILRYEKSQEWTEIKKLLNRYNIKSGKVLDYGAGRGICSVTFAKNNYDVYSLDSNDGSEAGLNSLKGVKEKRSLNIEIINSDFQKIPFDDNYFDLVYARQSLHHSGDLTIACSEIRRVLKKGGMFFALKDHVIDNLEDKNIFLKNHPLHEFTGDENAFLLDDYKNAFKNNNFKVVKILKTYSSAINYDPNTLENILEHYTKNKFFLGTKVFQNILLNDGLVSNFLKSLIIFLINLRDKTPGRPYSFILEKKK